MKPNKINYIACLQVQKEDRVYSIILPDNAPFEETHEAILEMAEGVLDIKKEREAMLEKAKLEQEMQNAVEEAKE